MNERAIVAKGVGFKTTRRYLARSRFVFRDVPLAGKRVLDVGCGRGAMGLWAAISGATHVVGLEPEREGSTGGSSTIFRRLVSELGWESRVEVRNAFLQDMDHSGETFDVAILYNMINHIDEEATSRLHFDQNARDSYLVVLRHLRSLLSPGAAVIVADCARANLWNGIGLKSPIVPAIEWEKHQEPKTWASLFEQSGFALCDIRWSSLYPFGRIAANRPVAYITASHFVMRLQADGKY